MNIKDLNESFKSLDMKESSDAMTLDSAVKEIIDYFEGEDLSDYDESALDERIENAIGRTLTYNEDVIDLWKELFLASSASAGIIEEMTLDVSSYLKDKVMDKLSE